MAPSPTYSAVLNPQGNYEVSDGSGAKVSTGSEGVLTQYGLSTKQLSTPTPVANPVADAVASGNGRYTGSSTSLGKTPAELAGPSAPPAPVDQDAIRAKAMDDVQAEINGIKSSFAGLVATAKDEGVNNLGKGRAIEARSGILGSDFGGAQQDKIQKGTDAKVDALNTQMNGQINAVMSKAQNRGDLLAKAAVDKATTDQNTYLANLKAHTEDARSDIAHLAGGGIPLDSLSKVEYNTLVEQSGYTPQVFDAVYNAHLPQNQQIKYTYEKMPDGTILPIYTDPVTHQPKTGAPISPPKSADGNVYDGFQVLPDGTPIFYNKSTGAATVAGVQGTDKTNFAKPLAPKAGTPGSKPVVSGKLKVSQDEISAGVEKLNASKGTDNFVDPNLFQNMYNVWVNAGGKGQDFIKQYPPKLYVNPANTFLPAYLKPTAAKAKAATGKPF